MAATVTSNPAARSADCSQSGVRPAGSSSGVTAGLTPALRVGPGSARGGPSGRRAGWAGTAWPRGPARRGLAEGPARLGGGGQLAGAGAGHDHAVYAQVELAQHPLGAALRRPGGGRLEPLAGDEPGDVLEGGGVGLSVERPATEAAHDLVG